MTVMACIHPLSLGFNERFRIPEQKIYRSSEISDIPWKATFMVVIAHVADGISLRNDHNILFISRRDSTPESENPCGRIGGDS